MSETTERRIRCCQRERTHLIQGGHGSGGGEYTQETVTVCDSCGQFRVSAMKNGVWTEVKFSIWNPDTLAAAGKPLERVRADEAKPNDSGCIHKFDAVTTGVACSKCGTSRDTEMQRQRDDLSEEMECCHRLLDKHYGLSTETVALDTLEDRLTELLAEIAKPTEPPPPCHCVAQTNRLLSETSPGVKVLTNVADGRPAVATVRTSGRGGGPVLFASNCPFCGTKYGD